MVLPGKDKLELQGSILSSIIRIFLFNLTFAFCQIQILVPDSRGMDN